MPAGSSVPGMCLVPGVVGMPLMAGVTPVPDVTLMLSHVLHYNHHSLMSCASGSRTAYEGRIPLTIAAQGQHVPPAAPDTL
jgi:hypothetical protein